MSNRSDDSVESRLVQVGEQLQIPSNTLQLTQLRLNQLSKEPDVDKDSLDDIAAAALALSAREDGLPISERDIAKTWTQIRDSEDSEISISHQQLEVVSSHLDIDDVPPHPDALINEFGETMEMSDGLINVAHRLLQDIFQREPSVVAGGPSPAATAGTVLSLAAHINDQESDYGWRKISKASGASEVTLRNRRQEFRDILGEERLQSDRYQIGTEVVAAASDADESEQSTVTDGAGTAETETTEASENTTSSSDETETEAESEAKAEAEAEAGAEEKEQAEAGETGSDATSAELGQGQGQGQEQTAETASTGSGETKTKQDTETGNEAGGGNNLNADVVEEEVNALVEELDIAAPTRLLARGMISDAIDDVDIKDASELAGTMVVAAAWMHEEDVERADVAELREFKPRNISHGLDALDETLDIDLERRDADEIIELIVEELSLSDGVREESHRSLARYNPSETDIEYTSAELGAGTVVFAATVSRTQVDIEKLAAISGANPEYITEAMNSIVTSLCLSLVRGEIDYEECSWTIDLLESELSPNIGDSYTGQVIAIAKTYTAGREEQHIDDSTLDVILERE